MSAPHEDPAPPEPEANRRAIFFGEGTPESVEITLTHELKIHLHHQIVQMDLQLVGERDLDRLGR
ncbi:hypothetical protein EON77_14190, partial [bacterium]